MKKVLSGLVLASTFVLTACGGGSSDSSSSTNIPNSTTTPTTSKTYINQYIGSNECKVGEGFIYVPNNGEGCAYKHPELTENNVYVYDCGQGGVVLGAVSVNDDPVPIANAPNGKDHIFEGKGVTVTCKAQ